MVQLSHLYMTTGKNIALAIWKVISLLFNMLSRLLLDMLSCLTPFLILNQFIVPCLVLYRFIRRQVRWSGIPISKNSPQFAVIYTIKVVNKADAFLESPCFFYDPMDVDNLISGSSASMYVLNIY